MSALSRSMLGLLFFVVCGLIVTVILAGETTPPVGMAAYSINGQIISDGHHSLDLSKRIFVRGGTPVCESEDALGSYAEGASGGCTIVSSSNPVGIVGIQTDGMREPSFQMQMQTGGGPVRGWVDYSNLQN
jgi:hypothetical protein